MKMNFMAVLLLLAVFLQPTIELEEKICGTIYVQSVKDLDYLENCTVIIGNLDIRYKNYDTNCSYEVVHGNETEKFYYDCSPEAVNNRSYPLREVTGYVFLFGLTYMDNLGLLFPNLTVIRGQRLCLDCALLLYDTDLAEIRLRNLLQITRGSVRIAGDNPNMCIPKIDWNSIIMNGRIVFAKTDVIMPNCTSNRCESCERENCWKNDACQRFDHTFNVTGSMTKKCHSLCLGKCVDPTPKGCFVCRDISESGECVTSCSSLRYLNPESRRCITAEECLKQGRHIHEKDCVEHCPAGYMVEMNNITRTPITNICMPCREKCQRICSYVPQIRSMSQLESIGIGCTIINGSLELNIVDDVSNLTELLHTYLGDVEEITGPLKIHRSPPLTSLTFLNNLRIVHSMQNESNFHAISIFENQNLQTLFDWGARKGYKLEIRYGFVQIFYNHMLCESEVERFRANLILSRDQKLALENKINETDVMEFNGYKRACKTDTIKTYSKVLSHDTVAISWQDSLINQTTNDTGYIVKYIPIDKYELLKFDENLLYDSDSCSSHVWKDVNIPRDKISVSNSNEFPNSTMVYTLVNLTQFTYYAFVMQRFNYSLLYGYTEDTKDSDILSGTSEVNMFHTFMNVPSRVANFSSLIKTTDSITLKWDVVEEEKDGIEKFLLFIYENQLTNDQIDALDYCSNPINYNETFVMDNNYDIDNKSDTTISYLSSNDDRCCEQCCVNQRQNEKELQMQEDSFEDSLIKFSISDLHDFSEYKRDAMMKRPGFKTFILLKMDVRSYTVTNLTTFTNYVFHIYTCADKCGDYEMLFERTAMDESFDHIQLDPIYYMYSKNELRIHFIEPPKRNGAIVSYTIEVLELEGNETHTYRKKCITRKQHETNKYIFSLSKIPEGYYVFRIRASSLARPGPYTDWHYFEVTSPAKKSSSMGLILFISIFIIILIVIIGATALYYNKHKIMTYMKRQNDTVQLINEMEPIDFQEISVNHNLFDRLSDISEYDDE